MRRRSTIAGSLWVSFGVLLVASAECVSWGLGLGSPLLVGVGLGLAAAWCAVTAFLSLRS